MMEKNIQCIDVELVKKKMELKNISDSEMAEKMGISSRTFKNFINGANQRYLSSLFLYRLAKALETSAQSLLNAQYR